MMGTLYFIRSGDTGPVKIGWTTDILMRQQMLQCGSPVPLSVIRTIRGERKIECWAHRKFHGLRIRGEWFSFCDEMLSWIPVEIAPPARESAVQKRLTPLSQKAFDVRKLRESLGFSQDTLAEQVGVNQATIHRWENGQRVPGPARKLLEQMETQ